MNFWIWFLNNWRQDSLFLAFIIILIILYWIYKILELYAELPQKIMPFIYGITNIVNKFFKFWGTKIYNYYACVICK